MQARDGISSNIRYPRSGFSLIEILVASVIMGVLLALLISGFGGFRKQLDHAACSSNLRILWMAAKNFAADHQERFTSLNIERSSGETYLKGFRDYVGYSQNVFVDTEYSCPGAQRNLEYAAGGNMFRSYGVNRRMVYNWAPEGVATQVRDSLGYHHRILFPERTFYLADGVPNPGGATKSGKGINYFTSVDYVNSQRAYFLHNSSINVVFMDGSIRMLDKQAVNKSKDHVLWGGELVD